MRLTIRICLLLAVASLLVLTASCSTTKRKKVATSSAGILTEKYSMGTYTAEFGAPMFFMDKAIRRACARARLTKTEHIYRTSNISYRFIDIDKVPISITLEQLEESSRVKIRISRFGDQDSSVQLAIAIDEELRLLTQTPPPAAVPAAK